MKIRVTLIKNNQEIARRDISDPKKGDIESTVTEVFQEARTNGNTPLWDCQINIREID